MNDFEAKKKEYLQPIFFEAGAALFDCQTFEYGIAYLLFLFSQLGVQGLSPENTTAILENESKKTAGQLIGLLKKHIKVSENIESNLAKALDARNIIAHRYLIDNVERFADSSQHESVVSEIRNLRSTIRNAHKNLEPFVRAMAKAVDDIDFDFYENEAKQQLLNQMPSTNRS